MNGDSVNSGLLDGGKLVGGGHDPSGKIAGGGAGSSSGSESKLSSAFFNQFTNATGDVDDMRMLNLGQIIRQIEQDMEEHEATPLWIICFTDVLGLMLTFFVMLYAMSAPHFTDFSGRASFCRQDPAQIISSKRAGGEARDDQVVSQDVDRALNIDYVRNLVNQHVEGHQVLDNIAIMEADERIIVSMLPDLTFDVGGADVGDQGQAVVQALSKLLQRIPNRVEVVGHADMTPIKSAGTAGGADVANENNWHLSLRRAASVSRALAAAGYERPHKVRGEGAARYDMLSQIQNATFRDKLARRVDIVIYSDVAGR